MSEIILLDVGHGNCAVLRSGAESAVIDAPIGPLLIDTLRDLGITQVDAAFVSHADKDHLAGIITLLTSTDVHVRKVFINPDSNRRTKLWRTFCAAVSVAERDGTCLVHTSLSTTAPGAVSIGTSSVKIVGPSARLALTGVGGKDRFDRTVTANSLSAVLNVTDLSCRGVLLAGDVDHIGLDDAIEHNADLIADVLVFPHHGGSPGTSATDFTQKLLKAVGPHSVYFSNGRGRFDNPKPEIVSEVVNAGCRVSCSQLAHACSDKTLDSDHLENIRAHGKDGGSSCAGSVTVSLIGGARRSSDDAEDAFRNFVGQKVPTPLCGRPRIYIR